MRKIAQAVLVVLALLGVNGDAVLAKATPDFSGKWAGDSGPTDILSITQDATTVTVARPGETTLTYRPDGSVVTNAYKLTNGKTLDVITTATWRDASLLVVTIDLSSTPGFPAKTYDKWTLDASGNLVIETTRYMIAVSTKTYKKIS